MTTVVAFAALAAVGALSRAGASRRWDRPGRLPVGTLAVNVSGSLALGLLAGAGAGRVTSTLVGTAVLGSYTTFSSFAGQLVALWREARPGAAASYLGATCVLGVTAAWLGLVVAGGA